MTLQNGYAHVIENKDAFPPTFGTVRMCLMAESHWQCDGSMRDLPVHSRHKQATFSQFMRTSKLWMTMTCTRMLSSGDNVWSATVIQNRNYRNPRIETIVTERENDLFQTFFCRKSSLVCSICRRHRGERRRNCPLKNRRSE